MEGFKELSPSDTERASAQCHWRWYEPEERILSQEDRSTDVFFIVQGRVRITNYSPDRSEVSFRDMGVGEIFGELAAIDGLPRSASAVALSVALLASMPARTYWRLLEAHPALTRHCLIRLARLVRALSDRVVEFATLSVRDRICAELLRLAARRSGREGLWEIERMPTHAELANRVATHREAVTRVLHKLELDGTIRREGRKLILADLVSLRSALEEKA
jgi:cAMP-binding proteins - catabolite gene activator and regulatory subunit of cAMP-dependent protein kinases